MNALTAEQTEALKQYIAEFNERVARNATKPKKNRVPMARNWKEALSNDWFFARRPGVLHGLRNTHGPEWLEGFNVDEMA